MIALSKVGVDSVFGHFLKVQTKELTWKEKSLPSRRIAAKAPDPKISDPAPAPNQKPALSRDRQHLDWGPSEIHRYVNLMPLDSDIDSPFRGD